MRERRPIRANVTQAARRIRGQWLPIAGCRVGNAGHVRVSTRSKASGAVPDQLTGNRFKNARRAVGYNARARSERIMSDITGEYLGAPGVVDRPAFQAQLDALRIIEKAHTRAGDALAAARRRLPMVRVDGATPLISRQGAATLLDAFEGRQMLIAYYFMWHAGHPAPEQCEGCTWVTSQVRELAYIHQRNVTFAVLCQGPYPESVRYRDFMGWEMPWYSAEDSLQTLLVGRRVGMMHLVCYLRRGSDVFETYWTWMRGVESMDNSYRLLDLTVYGRQENWEDSPPGWPIGKEWTRTNGRPTAQWPRLDAGHSDELG
jgi:predicted dithiol-disulfide oxidoreductase (DUF899 family)